MPTRVPITLSMLFVTCSISVVALTPICAQADENQVVTGGEGKPNAPADLLNLTFHTFDVEEVFSNLDGSVQFVELREADGLNGENVFTGKFLTTDANQLIFPTDLPDTATAGRFVLIATPNFALLPGAVTPDYIVPPNFFSTVTDTFVLRVSLATAPTDTFGIGTGELPLDGVNSLSRSLTVAPNSPTNFAGETGSIRVFNPVPTVSAWGILIMLLMLVAAATFVLSKLRRSRTAH